jgi:hypothetical protein
MKALKVCAFGNKEKVNVTEMKRMKEITTPLHIVEAKAFADFGAAYCQVTVNGLH